MPSAVPIVPFFFSGEAQLEELQGAHKMGLFPALSQNDRNTSVWSPQSPPRSLCAHPSPQNPREPLAIQRSLPPLGPAPALPNTSRPKQCPAFSDRPVQTEQPSLSAKPETKKHILPNIYPGGKAVLFSSSPPPPPAGGIWKALRGCCD